MPTAYEDQFFTVDPGGPPAVGTPLVFQRVEFIDEDDNGLILNNSGDTFNGVAVTQVWQNDTLTVELPNGTQVTYTGVTFYLQTGPAVFTPTDGQVLQNGTFVSSTFVTNSTQTPVGDFGPTCFTPGTYIDTPDGARRIETLCVGDMVMTIDNGPQPIRQILDAQFRAAGDVAPIRFAQGVLGNTAPLIVSPQHRMLISGWQAELFYGEEEVLVAAKHLVNGTSVQQISGGVVRYIHLVFDEHQLIYGQGVPSESCHPRHGTDAESPAREELSQLFPEVAKDQGQNHAAVRPVLRRNEALLLAA